MPPASLVEESSAVSESQRAIITSRDGGLCILCGMDPVNVAHIVAPRSGDQSRVSKDKLPRTNSSTSWEDW